MKRCPNCNQTFGDENDFCLNDGTPLLSGGGPFGGYQSSGETPTQFIPRPSSSMPTVSTPGSNAGWLFPLVGILCGLVIVLGYFAFFSDSGSDKSVEPSKNTESVKADKPSENSPPARPPQPTPFAPPQPADPASPPIVTVNSPRDGFLALKTEPCVAPCGKTLFKIPHGTRLALGTCNQNYELADRKRGRWCYVTFQNQTGWIFDGFVTY